MYATHYQKRFPQGSQRRSLLEPRVSFNDVRVTDDIMWDVRDDQVDCIDVS